MEPEEFVGCILTITTLPSAADGASKAIIGTVRFIDPKRQTLTLDEVMINGMCVDDGYILNSAIIQDLSVCKKIEPPVQPESHALNVLSQQPEPAFTSTPKKPLQDANISLNNKTSIATTSNFEVQIRELGTPKQQRLPAAGTTSKKMNNVPAPHQQHAQSKSSAFVKTEKGRVDKSKTYPNPFYAINPALGGPMGNGPPPTKPSSTEISKSAPLKINDTRVVYTASDLEKKYFDQESKSPTKSKVLESIMAQFSGSPLNKDVKPTPTVNLATPILVNKVPSIQDQNVDPAKNVFNITADNPLYKLFAPQQLQAEQAANNSSKNQLTNTSRAARVDNTKSKSPTIPSLFQKNTAKDSDRARTGKNDRGKGTGADRTGAPASTFEMTNDEIRAQEFDFEENLAMFEKLPVSITPKPTVVKAKEILNHTPAFGKADTTYYAERHVSSIKLKETPSKVFVTDTGVVVPAVSLRTRSNILNLAHNFGFTHERMVEVMGRAVAQTALPMLGDSYRLSPEREEDRPTVLVFAGPHWNGAVGLCSARILATQGIRTIVYIWNYELPLFTTELQLYRLTKQSVVTDVKELTGVHVDLVIGGMHDHRDATIHDSLFQKCSKGKPVVLVDPPLLPSYRKHILLETGRTERGNNVTQNEGNRLAIVTPTLPLAYPVEPSVKLHLVNLGIPHGIFEQNEVLYKSPFGDKLILQLFATKQDIAAISSN